MLRSNDVSTVEFDLVLDGGPPSPADAVPAAQSPSDAGAAEPEPAVPPETLPEIAPEPTLYEPQPALAAVEEIAVHAAAPAFDDPRTISPLRILQERPDVLSNYFNSYAKHHKPADHAQWASRIGGDSAEAFATHWYQRMGRFEGYSQGQTTAGDAIDLGRLILERQDVVSAYYRDHAIHHGWKDSGWQGRMDGSTLWDYAKYWFRNHGEHEGYNQRPHAAPAADAVEAPVEVVETPTTEPVVHEPVAQEPLAQEPVAQEPVSQPPPAAESEPPAPADLPEIAPPADEPPPVDEDAIVIVGAAPDDPIFG